MNPILPRTLVGIQVLLAASLVVPCALLGGETLPMRSIEPPMMLPDGSEFKTWEQPLRFDRTYYVDQTHPKASDTNPGTSERPFATINQAAQVLQPGERVVVASGIYRERVRPVRGGSAPDRMISYEAAPGATVVVKGSRVFKPSWRQSRATTHAEVWEAALDPALFDGYNPFAIDNVTPRQFEIMDWATPLRGKVPYTLPRGLVFQDGKLLSQVATSLELAREGIYWVDRTNQVLHLHLATGVKPDEANIEITTQETVFAPEQHGLGFIRVKGLTIEHAGGPFPWEQVGAISTTRGHHWIIEDNIVRWANGVGMDLGIQNGRWPQPPVVGFHIVRRNLVTDCGICGICGLGPARGRDFGLLIEDNVLQRNAFYDVERLFETAAIKTHNNIRCVIRRNLILDTLHGAGIWMDWNNQFSRCSQNVIAGTHTIHGAIFFEASYEPNLVDQNVIFDTDGHGIYEHDSTRQTFAHNLIVRSSKSGLHLHGKITDRQVDGRTMTYGRHIARNNVLIDNARSNEFLGEPSDATDNVADGATAALDLRRQTITWTMLESGRTAKPVSGITHDLLGRPRLGNETCAGPFAAPQGSNVVLPFWPRHIWPGAAAERPPGLITSEDVTAELDGSPIWVENLTKACPPDAPDWFRYNTSNNLAVNIAAFTCTNASKLSLHFEHPVKGLTVRPKHLGIAVSGQERDWSLALPGPCKLYIEAETLPPLLVFADSPEDKVAPESGDTRIFGPGVHDPGLITLKDNARIYLAPGAVVYGGFRGKPRNAKVFGRGILDGSKLSSSMVELNGASNVVVEGIIMRCGKAWQNTLQNCDNITYRNVKILSFVPYGDGIDPVCSRNIRIENCFFRCSDDCIAVKAMQGGPKVSGITVQDCVMAGYNFSDGFTIGYEAVTEAIEDITVKNCDILYARGATKAGQHSAFSIICDGPATVRNVTFEDIRVEENITRMFELNVTDGNFYSKASPGRIQGVRLNNISWEKACPILITGHKAEHLVEDVVFERCRAAGVPLSLSQIQTNAFTRGIAVR
jgi:hypothetical protein